MSDRNWGSTMKIDRTLQLHITTAFEPLNNEPAVHAFPEPDALSRALSSTIPAGSKMVVTRYTSPNIATMFTTAAVNMWMRAVHSFLVSVSLTEVSPIWASVAGYYSSHYAVRAIAHLLGFVQLYNRRQIVRLELQAGRYICTFNPKAAGDREHSFYWKTVKRDQHFAGDPFFTENIAGKDDSDVGHRDRANYADHLPQFPVFRPLDVTAVKNRVYKLSEIELASPPIPRVSKYPDVESVQLIAYHRLIRFRDLVDTVIGGQNRFWSVYRNPAWAREFMDFQLTAEDTLHSQFTLN